MRVSKENMPLRCFSKAVGQRCKDKRIELKMTQGDVANATGLKCPDISKFERGHLGSYYLLLYYVMFLKTDLNGLGVE